VGFHFNNGINLTNPLWQKSKTFQEANFILQTFDNNTH